MATDQGPHYSVGYANPWVYYYGFFSESTYEMLEVPDQTDPTTYYAQPGFVQKWGAIGYFIRPEYLDPYSLYRPQTLAQGNIPPPISIGLA